MTAKEKIVEFVQKWEEKRMSGYYTGTEELVVINTFEATCKMLGYDFDINRNANNDIDVAVFEIVDGRRNLI